ncbi:MAG: caspase domain-containing protein [Gammaproteobacteria bacterium]
MARRRYERIGAPAGFVVAVLCVLFVAFAALLEPVHAVTLKPSSVKLTHDEHGSVEDLFSSPRRIALLVGINEFEDKKWGRLRYAVKDAHDFAAVLNDERYGQFDHVMVLTRPEETTRSAIIKALKSLARYNLSENDTIVIYFSSHGTLAKTRDGKLHQYIVTRDTWFSDIQHTAIDIADLKHLIGHYKSTRKVTVLAFCHSGKGKSQLDENLLAELAEIKSPFFVKPIEDKSEANVVLAASGWGETAREDKTLQNDIYTHFLIEGIQKYDRNEDGAVTVTEAHDYARQQTYYLTKGEQRPSLESEILGVDPIVLSGKFKRQGKPVIYDYSDRFEDMVVMIDGETKGTLPIGLALQPGFHKVEVASSESVEPAFVETFEISNGEQLSLPLIIQGYDQGVAVTIGYQGFITDEVDRNVSGPLSMLGLSYSRHAFFGPNLGYRADLSYGEDQQVLQVNAVTSHANVSQTNIGLSLLYRNKIGSASWYAGPRLGALRMSRDLDLKNSPREVSRSSALGAILGIHFRYKQQMSLAIESTINYTSIQVSGTDTNSMYYNLFGALSVNF